MAWKGGSSWSAIKTPRDRPTGFYGGKSSEKAAEEAREQQVAVFRNVPIQGIRIEDIDLNAEVYNVRDDSSNTEVAYAPVILHLTADSLEDLLRFVVREDFRKVEILDPPNLLLTRYDVERLLFRVHEELRNYKTWLERKLVR
mgnify:CR=1 FL=1